MNTGESSVFSFFLLYLLIFLLAWQTQARKQHQNCSSSCGGIKNIMDPFRLKGDPKGCGYPEFELSCEDNKTILEYLSGKYYVKRISYEDGIIGVVDVKLANGSCSLPSKSTWSHHMVSYYYAY
ncbi:putative Kinase, partial [Melia azedarach]